MLTRLILGLAAIVLLTALGGCGGGGGPAAQPAPPDVPLLSQNVLWVQLFREAVRPRVVDIRAAADFEQSRLPYSENAPDGVGAVPAGLVNPSAADEIIVVGRTQADAAYVVADLIDQGAKARALAGGFAAWVHGLDVNDIQLKQWMDKHRAIELVDVRTPEEFAEAHIPDSVNRPLGDLDTWAPSLNPDAEYVMICGVGKRSATARDALAQRGFQRVHNLLGGIEAWRFDLDCGG